MTDVSIIVPLYNEQDNVARLCAATHEALARMPRSYELVLVNDGSPDDSLAVALALQAADPHVVVVDLSRNFGHHRAMMTGVALATGDRIFLLDCDLEEPPELLGEFDACMRASDCDLVYGVQEQRKGHWFERVSGDAYYRLFNLLSSAPGPRNIVTARLFTRRMQQALIQWNESVKASVAGKDYPEGQVHASEPPTRNWIGTPEYAKYLAEWRERPEFNTAINKGPNKARKK